MSWEHTKRAAKCSCCGRVGWRIDSSDDWGHSKTSWEGFKTAPQSDYIVSRKRVAPDGKPVCDCGSSQIEVSNTPEGSENSKEY